MRGNEPVPQDERHDQHAKFAGAFRARYRSDPDTFQHQAKQIRELAEMPGWDVLMDVIKDVYDSVAAELVNAWPPPEPEIQARWVGEMRGLQELLGIAQTFDVVSRHEMAKLAEIAGSNNEGG